MLELEEIKHWFDNLEEGKTYLCVFKRDGIVYKEMMKYKIFEFDYEQVGSILYNQNHCMECHEIDEIYEIKVIK